MSAPIESKALAAPIGGGGGAVFAALLLWAIGVLFFGASPNASSAALAVAAVPAPVSMAVTILATAGFAFLAAYLAKHTPRIEEATQDALGDLPSPADLAPAGTTLDTDEAADTEAPTDDDFYAAVGQSNNDEDEDSDGFDVSAYPAPTPDDDDNQPGGNPDRESILPSVIVKDPPARRTSRKLVQKDQI